MSQHEVSYDRPLLHTRRGVAQLARTSALVSVVAIAIAAVRFSPGNRWHLLSLTLYVILNAAATFRILGTLKKIESRLGAVADDVSTAIFDHSIFLQVLGLNAVLAALWLSTGR